MDAHGNAPRPVENIASDLIARYQDYVARRMASSRATRDTYEQLLGRVASGELDPTALDRGLNHFLQSNGPEYASRIADLSMRFLAGLVQAGSRSANELFGEVAPGAVEPVADPPEFDPTDWAGGFERLMGYAETARSAQIKGLRVVMDRVASGELDPEAVERITNDQSREAVPDGVTRLAELYVDMLTGLEEMNARFGNDYLRSIVRRLEQPHSIELSGEPGESVEVRLVVANDEAHDATMRCVISDVRRDDGIGPAFDPEVAITPDRFDLAPDAEARVSCSMVLTDSFAPDATYVGEVRVLTDTETVLAIPLRIRAGARSVTP